MLLDISNVWRLLLNDLLTHGVEVAPRGKLTKELPQYTLTIDLTKPVLTVAARKLSYRYMAAEAHWILTGDNRVDTLAPYNVNIANYSDDGVTFFGAYGPKIVDQLPYVLECLTRDQESRQAGLTIWREKPGKTKDVPCTVAIFFSIRRRKLHVHVFMRSSDAWLGIPYDVFTFSMLGHLLCAKYNELVPECPVQPGILFLTAASSHLYQTNWDAARECLVDPSMISIQESAPEFWRSPPHVLLDTLGELKDSKKGNPIRWWTVE